MIERILGEDHPPEVLRAVPALTAARLASNSVYRFTPPFLSVIGRGLGVPIESMGSALAVADLAGLAAPFVGVRIDRARGRVAMLAGSSCMIGATLIAATAPHVAVYGSAFVLVGLAKIVYDTAMGAWLADRVSYERRARVIGFTELSWAGAMLLAIPICALLVRVFDWRAALLGLAVANLASLWRLSRVLPKEPSTLRETARDTSSGRLAWDVIRPALGGIGAFALLMTAVQFVFVVFGAWLDEDLGFSALAIGMVAFLLGFVELVATTSTIRFTDRVGKRRAALCGASLMIPTGLALVAFHGRADVGIALLAAFILGFEFALVSAYPLMLELVPTARASGLGLAIGLGTLGRGVASFAGTRLFAAHGFAAPALVASACAAACALLFWFAVEEP